MKKKNLNALKLKKSVISNVNFRTTTGGKDTALPPTFDICTTTYYYTKMKIINDGYNEPYWANICFA